MRFLIYSLICFFVVKNAFAQKKSVSIAIFLPENMIIDKSFQPMADSLYPLMQNNIKEMTSPDKINSAKTNQKIYLQNLSNIANQVNLYNSVSLLLEGTLRKELKEGLKEDSLLLFVADKKTTINIEELKKIATEKNVRFLIGFSEVHYGKIKEKFFTKIKGFLYDNEKGDIIFHREYDNTTKFETDAQFAKKEITKFFRASRDVCMKFGKEIFEYILPTVNFINKNEIIKQQRKYLVEKIYDQPINTEIYKIISENKRIMQFRRTKNISLENKTSDTIPNDKYFYHQGFFSPDKQKFVAFIWGKKHYSSVGIEGQTGKQTKEQYDAYNFETVLGVFYKGKWYINSSGNGQGYNHFKTKDYSLGDAKKIYPFRLIEYNFFNELSVEPNPDFWETKFFEKTIVDYSEDIEDVKKIMDKDKNPNYLKKRVNLIKIKELKQLALKKEKYKDTYEFVANNILEEETSLKYNFNDEDLGVSKIPLLEKFDSIMKNNNKEIFCCNGSGFQHLSLKYYINCYALQGKKGNPKLHFFLFDDEKQEIYEWLYFKPEILNQKISNIQHKKEIPKDETKDEPRDDDWVHWKDKGTFYAYAQEISDNKILKLTDSWLDGNYSHNWEFLEDEKFWQEYVFKKQGDKYLYLKPLFSDKMSKNKKK